jgi:hypothetical protein
MSEHKAREDRLAVVEERLAKLEQVLDTNTAVFSDSLQISEICIQALQRAFDDLINGRLKTVKVEGDRAGSGYVGPTLSRADAVGVDFKAYMQDALAQHAATAKAESSGPSALAPSDIVFEFGG